MKQQDFMYSGLGERLKKDLSRCTDLYCDCGFYRSDQGTFRTGNTDSVSYLLFYFSWNSFRSTGAENF